jgi:hypothetical protein
VLAATFVIDRFSSFRGCGHLLSSYKGVKIRPVPFDTFDLFFSFRGAVLLAPSVAFLQGSTKLSSMDHMIHGIFVLAQKESNAKKESYFDGTSKIDHQICHSKQEKQKSISKFFYPTILCFPDLLRACIDARRLGLRTSPITSSSRPHTQGSQGRMP